MFSARQRLLMRRTRDRAILIAIAPLGAVVLLPDPDFRRRIFRCVSHVGLAFVALRLAEMDRWNANNAQRLGAELHDCFGVRSRHPDPRRRPKVLIRGTDGAVIPKGIMVEQSSANPRRNFAPGFPRPGSSRRPARRRSA